jgi:hypothetical protein
MSSSTMVTQRPIISIRTQKIQADSDVPGSVRNLLLSIKQLQELLQLWSVGQATEGQVSDAYVKIGTDFNATVHAFASHHIDLRYMRASSHLINMHTDMDYSDIHSVPKELRTVLENCLGEDASSETLERYMPEVRRVLYRLMKGLQSRQDEWRATGGRAP